MHAFAAAKLQPVQGGGVAGQEEVFKSYILEEVATADPQSRRIVRVCIRSRTTTGKLELDSERIRTMGIGTDRLL
jgi:hypothetical protein